ncbi:MAG: hypothetical protein ACJAZK_002940 [Psychroserpens sp.]|jgi:hypothetical protein
MHVYSFEKIEIWKEAIQLIISKELNFISEESLMNSIKDIGSITNKINSLRNHFLK